MFVKVYRYKIKSGDFKKVREIEKKAEKIYKKYGTPKQITMFKKEGHYFKFLLMEFYRSEKDFEEVLRKVNKDPEIKKLWGSFLDFALRVTEEDFNTASQKFIR